MNELKMEFKLNLNDINLVAGYHLNPATCGVAKFNQIIADHYKISHVSLFEIDTSNKSPVFISIKISEMNEKDFDRFEKWVFGLPKTFNYYLFLHDFSDSTSEITLIKKSLRTFCGNIDMYNRIKAISPTNLQLMWSPGTLKIDWPESNSNKINIFSFGMAHKLRASYYHRVKELFDKSELDYQLFISTAIHEGTSLENMLESSFEDLRQIFGDKVKYLGYLSDFALHEYLKKTDYLVAFFQKGLRANNSSINTALEMGLPVITNLDNYSPEYISHGVNIFDIEKLESIPTDKKVLDMVSKNAVSISDKLSWASFFKEIARND